jgi:hypothetical protein
MSKTILIRPLLVLLTFIIIIVLLLMLIFGGFGGGDDEQQADDAPPAAEKTEEPAAAPKKTEKAKTAVATPAEPKKKNPIAAADLKAGDCIADATATLGDVRSFEHVACDEPHDGEVYTLITMPGAKGAKYPGPDAVNAKGQRGCRARLRRQATAKAYQDRELGYKFVYPTRVSWADGDRDITCLATFKRPRSTKLAQK